MISYALRVGVPKRPRPRGKLCRHDVFKIALYRFGFTLFGVLMIESFKAAFKVSKLTG